MKTQGVMIISADYSNDLWPTVLDAEFYLWSVSLQQNVRYKVRVNPSNSLGSFLRRYENGTLEDVAVGTALDVSTSIEDVLNVDYAWTYREFSRYVSGWCDKSREV